MIYINTNYNGTDCWVFYTSTANGALDWVEILTNAYTDQKFTVSQDKPDTPLEVLAPSVYASYRSTILRSYNPNKKHARLVVIEGGKS